MKGAWESGREGGMGRMGKSNFGRFCDRSRVTSAGFSYKADLAPSLTLLTDHNVWCVRSVERVVLRKNLRVNVPVVSSQ